MARISCWILVLLTALASPAAMAASVAKTGASKAGSGAASCESITSKGSGFKGSQWECEARLEESALIAHNPGLVARNGDALTVAYAGRTVATLTPTAAPSHRPGDCDSLVFSRALRVYDPQSKGPQNAAEITCHSGAFENEMVVRPDGTAVTIYADGAASPDGRVIIAGEDKAWAQAALTVYDWPSMHVAARFAPACRLLKWTGPARASVTCVYFPDAKSDRDVQAFDADLSQDGKGGWQLQATQWRDPNHFDRKTNLPMATKRMWPLPHFASH